MAPIGCTETFRHEPKRFLGGALLIRQTTVENDAAGAGIGCAIPAADARAYAEEWLADEGE